MAKDPVCGMDVDQGGAGAAGLQASYRGRTFSFCSHDCKRKFENDPARYVRTPGRSTVTPPSPPVLPRLLAPPPDRDTVEETGVAFPQMPRSRGMAGTLRPRILPGATPQATPPPAARTAEGIEPPARQAQQEAPPEAPLKSSMDPACRVMVDEESAAAAGLTSKYKGRSYYFVSKQCKEAFDKEPGKYLRQ